MPTGLAPPTPDAGRPADLSIQARLDFESLVAELSATFVNLAPEDVDSRVESALGRLVHFLQLERGSLAEIPGGRKELMVTHSHAEPGLPKLPNGPLHALLPWYAGAILRGEVLRFNRLPDVLPAEATREREYCAGVGMKSHVMIPLKIEGALVGAIGFASFRRYVEWPDSLIRPLRLAGEIFANAIARKQADEAFRASERSLQAARERLRELAARLIHAQEEERRLVAREMHDDWTQRLAILGIDLADLEGHLDQPGAARPLLQAMREKLVSLSEDVHALSRQLHPVILDDLGLAEALRSECASVSRREGVAVDYQAPGVALALPKDVALCVYRVAQEALRNLVKYAAVGEATVTLAAEGPDLLLCVRDEGAGFDPAAARAGPALGLCSMEERARLVGGTLTVTSAPGRGTTVEIRVPLDGRGP